MDTDRECDGRYSIMLRCHDELAAFTALEGRFSKCWLVRSLRILQLSVGMSLERERGPRMNEQHSYWERDTCPQANHRCGNLNSTVARCTVGYSCGYTREDPIRAFRSQFHSTVVENLAMESREVIGGRQSESEPSKPRVAASSPARRAIFPPTSRTPFLRKVARYR